MSKTLKAKRMALPVGRIVPTVIIDSRRVESIKAHLKSGGVVPPVVAARFEEGDLLPIDGHHRLYAHQELGIPADAWVITAKAFDALCCDEMNGRAESRVLCGGIPAMNVAI